MQTAGELVDSFAYMQKESTMAAKEPPNDVLSAARRHFGIHPGTPQNIPLQSMVGDLAAGSFYAGAAWGATQRLCAEDLKALAAELAALEKAKP